MCLFFFVFGMIVQYLSSKYALYFLILRVNYKLFNFKLEVFYACISRDFKIFHVGCVSTPLKDEERRF